MTKLAERADIEKGETVIRRVKDWIDAVTDVLDYDPMEYLHSTNRAIVKELGELRERLAELENQTSTEIKSQKAARHLGSGQITRHGND